MSDVRPGDAAEAARGLSLRARIAGWIAAFRTRIEPGLPPRRQIARLMVVMAGLGLALHVASILLTDSRAIRTHIAEGIAAGDMSVPGVDDNFCECMSMSILVYETGRTGIESVMRMTALHWTANMRLCDTLAAGIADESVAIWKQYGRYWHGNLTLQRAWLDRGSYAGLKEAGRVLVFAAVAAFLIALAWRAGILTALATGALGLVLSDVIAVSTQPTQAISLATLFFGAALFLALPRRLGPEAMALAAVGIGAAYNYFDFLYNPGLLAGLIGWAVVLRGFADVEARTLAWRAVGAALMVLVGYLLMWAAKWGLAILYMLATFDFFPVISPFNFTQWTAGGVETAWPLEALYVLASAVFGSLWAAGLALGALVLALAAAGLTGAFGRLWLILLPLGVTLAALELASGHSVSHGFTARALPWVLAAFCGGALYLAQNARKSAPVPPAAPVNIAANP